MAVPYTSASNLHQPIPTINVPKKLEQALGSGLTAPISYLGNNVWGTRDGVGKLKQDMYIALATGAGRRYLQCDYGSMLPYYLFEGQTRVVSAEMKRTVKNTLKTWVPQIEVIDVVVDLSELENDKVTIVTQFMIKGTAFVDSLIIVLQTPDTIVFPPENFTVNGRQFFQV